MREHREYKIILLILITSYVFVFFVLAQLRYHSFFSYEWEDQAEVNRLYWNISQGKFVDLYKDILSTGRYYKVHFLWISFAVAAFYKLYPHIQSLFFIISSSLAISAIPIYLIALRLLKSRLSALLLASSYLFYAPKHSLNFLDSDPIIFIIPLLLFAFYAAIKAKTRWLYFLTALVLICKTESPLFVITFAAYLYVQRKQLQLETKTCLILFFSGVLFCFLNFYLYQKISSNSLFDGLYIQNSFDLLDFASQYNHSAISAVHGKTLFQLFWPVLLLPIFSWELYVGLPSLVLIILTQDFVFQKAHYISGVVPFIFIGTIYVIKKFPVRPRLQLLLSLLVLAGCVMSNFGHNVIGAAYPSSAGIVEDKRFLSANNIFDKRFYLMDEDDKIAWRLIKMVPDDTSVTASGDLLVPFSSRAKLYEFLNTHFDYYNVDYMLLHNKNAYIGAGHYEWDDKKMREELDKLLKDENWSLLEKEGNFFLFIRKKKAAYD